MFTHSILIFVPIMFFFLNVDFGFSVFKYLVRKVGVIIINEAGGFAQKCGNSTNQCNHVTLILHGS